ncbi:MULTISPECIES: hypothetical protein [unclassified Synechocystis]|uniref:hypothetical protein n=1 Tax=unclassified Synechocystis TaxID=2640012 RepID=UPI00041F6A1E|nr:MULTISPECIES: hypothetical protein [unclassified Synechocystis]AIE73095.1 hypothetical protein D082_05660 [Synechocystis sp. PCC 6714]MCT0254379.1 hypothetical protein [Synechocystis sp. CS-94]
MTPWTIWFKTADNQSWQPLDSCRSLPLGHYRLAARLAVPHKYVQWRWKFFSATGKVENHDFQGRTNQEGLISLLDLHTVQPGTWQLNAQPDLFDQLCGETWQIRFQFQIVSPAMATVTVPKLNAEPEEFEPEQETEAANNAIVPHPMRPMVVPELDPEPVPVLQWHRKTRVKLTENEAVESSNSLEIIGVEGNTENIENRVEEKTVESMATTAPGTEKTMEENMDDQILEPVVTIAANVEAREKQVKETVQEEILEPVAAMASDVFAKKEEIPEDQQPEALVVAKSSADTDAEDQLEKSERFNPFRSISYSVELIYPELENPIQVDITVIVDENRRPANLNLPDPRRMISPLHRRPNKSRSPLPPKLTSTVD